MLVQRTTRSLILVVLSLIAVIVWSLPHLSLAGESHQRQHRANLQLCIENLDRTPASNKAMGKIMAAFKRVQAHRHFKDAQLDRGGGPTIMAGCPSEATIKSKQWAGFKFGAPNLRTEPSNISTFVFIVSQEEAQRAFGNIFPRITPQEIMCDEHKCGEVSTASYITPAELENFDVLVRSLSWGVGLIPEGEQLPTEHAAHDKYKE
jgi:hypothetical protein